MSKYFKNNNNNIKEKHFRPNNLELKKVDAVVRQNVLNKLSHNLNYQQASWSKSI